MACAMGGCRWPLIVRKPTLCAPRPGIAQGLLYCSTPLSSRNEYCVNERKATDATMVRWAQDHFGSYAGLRGSASFAVGDRADRHSPSSGHRGRRIYGV